MTNLSKNAENVKDNDKSEMVKDTSSDLLQNAKNDDNGPEEEGWTKVISRKRKNVPKNISNAYNVNEKYASNNSSSDDSFITNEKPQKKKIQKSKPRNRMVNNSKSSCPICNKSYQRVLVHLSRSKLCQSQCSREQMELLQKESKLKCAKRKKEFNQSILKEKLKIKNRKAYEKVREKDQEGLRKRMKINSSKYRGKQNPEVLKESNRICKIKSRVADTSYERLKNFLLSTLHNAVFICISCHQRCFKSNVIEYTKKVEESISSGRISKHK